MRESSESVQDEGRTVLQVQVLPGLVSAGRASLSPAGGGGCRTAD